MLELALPLHKLFQSLLETQFYKSNMMCPTFFLIEYPDFPIMKAKWCVNSNFSVIS